MLNHRATEPFDVTLPDGFELGVDRRALEEAAREAGWTLENDGPVVVERGVWTENRDHAAGLVATRSACRWSESRSGPGVASEPAVPAGSLPRPCALRLGQRIVCRMRNRCGIVPSWDAE